MIFKIQEVNDIKKRIIIINFLSSIKHFFLNISMKSHTKANRSNNLSDTT